MRNAPAAKRCADPHGTGALLPPAQYLPAGQRVQMRLVVADGGWVSYVPALHVPAGGSGPSKASKKEGSLIVTQGSQATARRHAPCPAAQTTTAASTHAHILVGKVGCVSCGRNKHASSECSVLLSVHDERRVHGGEVLVECLCGMSVSTSRGRETEMRLIMCSTSATPHISRMECMLSCGRPISERR